MAEQVSRRVEAVGLGDKRRITVTLADYLDVSFFAHADPVSRIK